MATAKSSLREWTIRLVLVLFGVLAGGAAVEFCLRAYERYVPEIPPIMIENYASQPVIDLAALHYNDTALPRKKPEDEFRVLSFGDSFAYGLVAPPYSYHGVAARIAAAAAEGRNVRVVNLGEPAVTFPHYIRSYGVWGKLLEHDAVIFNVYLGNDFLDIVRRFVPEDAPINRLFLMIDLSTGQPRKVRPPDVLGMRSAAYLYQMMRASQLPPPRRSKAGDHYIFTANELPEADWLEIADVQLDNSDPVKLSELVEGYRHLAALARKAAAAAANGKKVLIVLSPNQAQVDAGFRDRVFRLRGKDPASFDLDLSAFMAAKVIETVAPGLPVLYVAPALRCAEERGLRTYWRTDTHWSEEGNLAVGEALGAAMAQIWFKRPPSIPSLADCAGGVGLPEETAARLAEWKTVLEPAVAK